MSRAGRFATCGGRCVVVLCLLGGIRRIRLMVTSSYHTARALNYRCNCSPSVFLSSSHAKDKAQHTDGLPEPEARPASSHPRIELGEILSKMLSKILSNELSKNPSSAVGFLGPIDDVKILKDSLRKQCKIK